MKITDKMRLDWLQKNKDQTLYWSDKDGKWFVGWTGLGKSTRQAIDHAIKADTDKSK